MPVKPFTLFYFHDPMCSWCWGFSRVFNKLTSQLPENINVQKIMGGLAPDTSEPMSDEMRGYVKGNWFKIEERIPGVNFNFDFWEKCQPRRSTYPACRAVIAARLQGEDFESVMIAAIQAAYYQQARNPSDDETLIELASELGLDEEKFRQDLNSENVNRLLQDEIDFCHAMFIESFPSLVIQQGDRSQVITIDYNDEQPMLSSIKMFMQNM